KNPGMSSRALLSLVVLSLSQVAAAAAPASPEAQPRELTYRQVAGQSLHAYVFDPAPAPGDSGAILLFHGGGWSEGAADWMEASARRFAGAGLVSISIEYRLARGETSPIDSLSDVCSAFQWVRAHAGELHVDPRKVAGYGVSAGGHLLASTVT